MEQFQRNVEVVVSALSADDHNMWVIQVDQDKANKQPEVNSKLVVDDFYGVDDVNAMAIKQVVRNVDS